MTTEAINRAQALVKRLRDAGVPAVIAGGFPRDALYNRRIKDVDVLVEVDDPDEILGLVAALKHVLGADLEPYELNQRGESVLYEVWQSPHSVLGLPVDVLFTNDIDLRVESFPDNLSKVVLDGTAVDQYPESLVDYLKRQITYTGDLTNPTHQSRLSRLLEKYEGFTVG